jgi:hypothetical protein
MCFKNMSKLLNKVRLEIWCDGENIFVGAVAVLRFVRSRGTFVMSIYVQDTSSKL